MPDITVSSRSYQRLLGYISSFEDKPADAVERVLDIADSIKLKYSQDDNEAAPLRSRSATKDDLLPEGEYWRPILELLVRAGGSARGSEIIDDLELRLADRLGDSDKDMLSMGEVRWRNRARFARLRMKELGLISDQSPRGIWEITEAGRIYLDDQRGLDHVGDR